MKYSFFLVIFIVISCATEVEKETKTNAVKQIEVNVLDTIIPEKLNTKLLEDYLSFLNKIDLKKMGSNLAAMEEFKRITVSETLETCDSAYLHYRKFYLNFQAEIGNKFQEDTSNYCVLVYGTVDEVDAKYLKKLKAERVKLRKYGIDFACTEGSPYITFYSPFVKTNFLPSLSLPLQKYLNQELMENEAYLYDDAGIVIQLKEVVDRIVWHEDFEKANPTFQLTYLSINAKMWHQTALFNGADNTPVYYTNEDVVEVNADFVNAMQYCLKKYPTSQLAKSVTPFLKALKASNLIKIEALRKKFIKEKICINYE
jgi:hypothetical protein